MVQQFTVLQPKPQVVEVQNGARGPLGPQGPQGPEGEQGPGFRMRGNWVNGATYAPGDAVAACSTLSASITSTYIQKESFPEGVSTIEPRLDPTRWSEFGYTDFGDALGSVWEVTQLGHGFARIGTPVQYRNGLYQLANSIIAENLALAVIREIIDTDRFILQSDGLVENVDPDLNQSTPGSWVDDQTYWLSGSNGLVVDAPPPIGVAQAMWTIVNGGDAVVFPYQQSEQIPLPAPAPAPATAFIALDDISPQFNDVAVTFALSASASPVPFGPSESFFIHIDGHAQQPLVDFNIVDNGGNADITFARAPFNGSDFWGRYATT